MHIQLALLRPRVPQGRPGADAEVQLRIVEEVEEGAQGVSRMVLASGPDRFQLQGAQGTCLREKTPLE